MLPRPSVISTLLSAALLSAGCSGDTSDPEAKAEAGAEAEAEAKAETPAQDDRPSKATKVTARLPRAIVKSRFPTADIAIIARATLGDRQAAIVWPAFRDGQPADDDIVAVAFRRQGMRWLPIGEVVTLSQSDGRRELAALLGGEKFTVERTCGVARGDLIPHIEAGRERFLEAAHAGRQRAAMRAYEELTPAFAFDLIAFDDLVTEWLLRQVQGGDVELNLSPDEEGDWMTVEITANGRTESGRLPLVRCAGGWALGARL